MFQGVLGQGDVPRGRFGTGAVLSAAIHAGLAAAVLWVSARAPVEATPDREIKLILPGRKAAPPPPAVSFTAKPRTTPVRRKVTQVVQPTRILPLPIPAAIQPPAPVEPDEPPAGDPDNGREGGVEGGTGNVVGAPVDPDGVPGLGGGLGGNETISFGAGMTAPRLLSGEAPQMSREALEAHVEGTMIVRCVITTTGNLERCRTLKPLPFMEAAVFRALATRQYTPVTYQGQPVSVQYVFNIAVKMPR